MKILLVLCLVLCFSCLFLSCEGERRALPEQTKEGYHWTEGKFETIEDYGDSSLVRYITQYCYTVESDPFIHRCLPETIYHTAYKFMVHRDSVVINYSTAGQ